ncbi:unnamed protein product [Dibothriocephalus latus]|uniref:Uncharacterized protein n=1 Tax=Dibothriocephalus latus TaxID=60516 RepID=A0A3P7NRZ8_DIBLA|nr:unnamed protein product [Dibothriocephalus latus]
MIFASLRVFTRSTALGKSSFYYPFTVLSDIAAEHRAGQPFGKGISAFHVWALLLSNARSLVHGKVTAAFSCPFVLLSIGRVLFVDIYRTFLILGLEASPRLRIPVQYRHEST